jgi:uncharacterized protein (TIGR00369 family)
MATGLVHVPVDEPVQGRFAYLEYPGILELSGFEQMQRFRRRELPYGPLWYLTGLDLVEFGIGSATFRLPVTGWLKSAAGLITGGALAFVADGALGSAILSTLPPRRVLATSDLTLDFIRPADVNSDAIIARARVIEVGRSQALCESAVEDTTGHLLAHATSRCIVTDVPGDLPDPPDAPVPWPDHRRPFPFERPPEGEFVAEEVWEGTNGIDIQRAWHQGRLARTPLSNLLKAELRSVDEGSVELAMPASPWFSNTGGAFYGGALALFADYAIHGAIQTTVLSATSWATLDLRVRFVRPIIPDGRPLVARARVVHRGRRLAVAWVEVVTADEKVAALADASAMLLPGVPWRVPAAPFDVQAPGHPE